MGIGDLPLQLAGEFDPRCQRMLAGADDAIVIDGAQAQEADADSGAGSREDSPADPGDCWERRKAERFWMVLETTFSLCEQGVVEAVADVGGSLALDDRRESGPCPTTQPVVFLCGATGRRCPSSTAGF